MSTVSCMTWVRRGVAKRQPVRAVFTDAEVKRVIDSHRQKLERIKLTESSDSNSDLDEPKRKVAKSKQTKNVDKSNAGTIQPGPSNKEIDDLDEDQAVIEKYGLDEDSDVDYNEDEAIDQLSAGSGNNSDQDSDDEDLEVYPEDNLITFGRVYEDHCNLDVYLYSEKDNNFYCHHDILLPVFPLTLEWLDFHKDKSSPGNLVAMGTMEPDIEIWDLDVIDCMEPAYVLKGAMVKKSKKKKQKTSISGHTDAVLGLSWNKNNRKVLASASADHTVGVWDLEQGTMATNIKQHSDKVQCVAWHPMEAQTLVSGAFDNTVRVYDCRDPHSSQKLWTLGGEIEGVTWNHHNPYTFLASTDVGKVYGIDVRETKPVFTLNAHSEEVTGLSLSPSIPGCLVTTSTDRTLRVWDIKGNIPVQVYKKSLELGEIHCCSCSPDSQLVVGLGGEREIKIINLLRNSKVCKHFNLTQLESRSRRREKDETDSDSEDSDGVGVVLTDSENNEQEADESAATSGGASNKKKKRKKKHKKKPRTSSLNRKGSK